MNEILGIIFIIRLFYWLATFIFRCFGIIKSDEEDTVNPEIP